MNTLGMVKVSAVSPKLRLANTEYNTEEIISCMHTANENQAGIILFPELCITGYSCGDLFYQDFLYKNTLLGLKKIAEETKKIDSIVIAGFHLKVENNYYNCAALIQNGIIKGIVPKMFPPNSKEFYEARWFASGLSISRDITEVNLFGYDIPFGNLIFDDEENDLKLGIEICEDLWVPISPGSHLCLNGAHIIFNPSASNEMVGKSEYRRNLVLHESAKNICGYVYASAGVFESTTDIVFGGDCLIAEYGSLIANGDRFQRESSITYGEIDFERLKFERAFGQNFEISTSNMSVRNDYQSVKLYKIKTLSENSQGLERIYGKNPFVPSDKLKIDERCQEIFSIQTAGLAKRLEHTRSKNLVLGISGGLDSTLALLVCVETMKLIGLDAKNIIAVTMPGFGTTNKTYQNALSLIDLLGVSFREIPIGESVSLHFRDINQDPKKRDVTYENAQARERTQILMDIANMEGGLVVGTGDLSEIALGFSTYNGDHMSMYGVNSSIPKTLVIFVIKWVMDNLLQGPFEEKAFSKDNFHLREILQGILDTPISPELLPPGEDGNIVQKTEDTVGPYILHDFFLFYTIRFGMNPRKLLFIATKAFLREFSEDEIKKWLILFYKRFFSQQFKRSCIPDGPKVGSVSLSPRGDWRMPSDAEVHDWLKALI
ncbi:MAG: NAD(+) synthase [Eubacteriales bacterium]